MERRSSWLSLALVLLAAALLGQPALAQPTPDELRPERLYLNPSGVLLGSTRVIALGGAFVGVAEGAAGFYSNLAALAHRRSSLERDWDVDFTASWLDLPFVSPARRDLDNDGLADQAQDTRQFLGALTLQYKQYGIGWYVRSSRLTYCKLRGLSCQPDAEQDHIVADVSNHALAGAVALGRDDLILALGLYIAQASFSSGSDSRQYGDTGVELDLLYRPHGLNYRIGVSMRPQVVGGYRGKKSDLKMLGERQLYSAVVSPAVLSLGGSVRLGEGSERYNRYSRTARLDIQERFGDVGLPPEQSDDAPAGSWMITAQVDLISATENTVALFAFTDPDVQTGLRAADPAGRYTLLAPHLGAEHDTIPGRLRTRVGTFIEPSPFLNRGPRVHATAGLEVYLFEYWDRWALSASADFAQRYYNVGLSVGLWR